jgi:hypothetical protein
VRLPEFSAGTGQPLATVVRTPDGRHLMKVSELKLAPLGYRQESRKAVADGRVNADQRRF